MALADRWFGTGALKATEENFQVFAAASRQKVAARPCQQAYKHKEALKEKVKDFVARVDPIWATSNVSSSTTAEDLVPTHVPLLTGVSVEGLPKVTSNLSFPAFAYGFMYGDNKGTALLDNLETLKADVARLKVMSDTHEAKLQKHTDPIDAF